MGTIDGKHVTIQAPARSGSLLAVCNAKHEFTLVHIGDAGRKSDSGIYRCSLLGRAIDENLLNFPRENNLSGYNPNILLPYTLVADGDFALKPNMLRPYSRKNEYDRSQLIFNYGLSRARRVI